MTQKPLYNIIAIYILSLFIAGCSRCTSKTELLGNEFCANDGATITFTSLDSCVIKNINWKNVFMELANELDFQEVYNCTWEYKGDNKIFIYTGDFMFDVYISSGIENSPFYGDGRPYIYIYIGDPDELNMYKFYETR